VPGLGIVKISGPCETSTNADAYSVSSLIATTIQYSGLMPAGPTSRLGEPLLDWKYVMYRG
jgi:hypothetical protein